MPIDVGDIVKSAGVQLERQATAAFGNAVEDFVRGKLGLRRPGTGSALPPELQTRSNVWDATSYAAALAGATEFRPKLKFLFKVQFFFTPEIIQVFPDLARNNFTFMIKMIDRPKVDFEYEDDINHYNFRTKVLKKIRHRELSVTFMDDVGNNVFDFFRTLMMIYSPIVRDSVKRDNQYNALPNGRKFETGSGMVFSDLGSFSTGDIAQRGVVDTYSGNAISLIRVKQIFIQPALRGEEAQRAISSNYYDFVNPRLISFDLDDLNHEVSDANLLTMQFDYDWLEMTKNSGIQSQADGLGPEYPVVVASKTGENGTGQSGITADILRGTNTDIPPAQASSTQGKTNPYINIIANAAGQITTKVTKDLVDKAVKGIVGDGRFANSRIGRAFSGGLTDALGNVTGAVGGIVSSAVRDQTTGLISTLSSGASQAGARISRSIFSDKSTVGADTLRSRVVSQPFYNSTLPSGDEGE